MTWRLRLKWKRTVREVSIKCVALILLTIGLCQRYVWVTLTLCLFCVIVLLMKNPIIFSCRPLDVESLCDAYKQRNESGNLCPYICESQEFRPNNCMLDYFGLKIIDHVHLRFATSLTAEKPLAEGLRMQEFYQGLEQFLVAELGTGDHSVVTDKLERYFDINQNGKLELGEAQSLWRLVHQPYFLVFFIFKDSVSVPHLNGTCGWLSVWQRAGDHHLLYHSVATWPHRLMNRWMLPKWNIRAKVMVSLLELVEDLYEQDGVRYHLCNLYGDTVFIRKEELAISHDTMLLSAGQVASRLSNVSCGNHLDCQLTEQCQTTCDVATRRCTDSFTKPTLTFACRIVEQYLFNDTPKLIKRSVRRLLQRCAALGLEHASVTQHSIVLVELKRVLWNYINFSVN